MMRIISCSIFSFMVLGLYGLQYAHAGDSERRIFNDSFYVTSAENETEEPSKSDKDTQKNSEKYSPHFWESYNKQNEATKAFLQELKEQEAKKKEVTGYNSHFRRHYFQQRRQCIAGLRRNYRRRQAEERRRQNRKEVDLSRSETTLVKSSHETNTPSNPLLDRGTYVNRMGDVIIDARFLKNIYFEKGVITCGTCNRKMNLTNVFNHYKKTKHRFFIKKGLVKQKK